LSGAVQTIENQSVAGRNLDDMIKVRRRRRNLGERVVSFNSGNYCSYQPLIPHAKLKKEKEIERQKFQESKT
jgi:hypothetical protein